MIALTEALVDAAAPNADAIKNGRALVAKGKLTRLCHSPDGTLLFGECSGSGSKPYHCSADYLDPANPVYRCSCPSRQFPCKHCLGLLYAQVMGKPFTEGEVPPDLLARREKVVARVEKKAAQKDQPAKPRTVNKGALRKKIEAQLQGLTVLETLVSDIIRRGLGTMDAKAAQMIDEQAKQLGDAFLPGAQGVLNELTALFRSTDGRFQTTLTSNQRDAIYREALERLTRTHVLARRGRDYLQQRLDDADLTPDITTSTAAWLGHAWQLTELEALGCMEPNAELVQLSFEVENNTARRQFIDSGVWFHLASGRLFRTLNIRPWKAAAHIRQDDTVFDTLTTAKLYRYPGEGAPRVRWEDAAFRPVSAADRASIRSAAPQTVADIVKAAREQLKSPLAERRVWTLFQFARIGKAGDAYVIEDATGARMELVNHDAGLRPPALPLLGALPAAAFTGQTLLGCIRQDWDSGRLVMEPVTLITSDHILRLGY